MWQLTQPCTVLLTTDFGLVAMNHGINNVQPNFFW